MNKCEDDLLRCEDEKDVEMRRHVQKRREVKVQFITHSRLSHAEVFTHQPFYTQQPLHTDAATHRYVLDTFTHENLYRISNIDNCTHKRRQTQTISHTGVFSQIHEDGTPNLN